MSDRQVGIVLGSVPSVYTLHGTTDNLTAHQYHLPFYSEGASIEVNTVLSFIKVKD